MHMLFYPDVAAYQELTYNEFISNIEQGRVKRLVIFEDKIIGEFKSDKKEKTQSGLTDAPSAPWRLRIPSLEEQVKKQFIVNRIPGFTHETLLAKLLEAKVDFKGNFEHNGFRNFFLNSLVPFMVFIGIWILLLRKMGTGHPMLDLGRNKAKIVAQKSDNAILFADVAGVDEAVEEVKEIVEFLKYPKRYASLGGKLPKGVLLVGPPGTGKTLLAKAVAGEAGVPFFSLSGSDFIEMFVGLGAARVRDLFEQAKKNAPCIIFIDEIDAIGKSRAKNAVYSAGSDERENTLNQLLVEMDGFDPGVGVIMMGATNRPDVLDPALLLPGRFDRQVLIDKPDMKGREAIFRVHTRKLKLSPSVDLSRLACKHQVLQVLRSLMFVMRRLSWPCGIITKRYYFPTLRLRSRELLRAWRRKTRSLPKRNGRSLLIMKQAMPLLGILPPGPMRCKRFQSFLVGSVHWVTHYKCP